MFRWYPGAVVALALLVGCATEVRRQAVELSSAAAGQGLHYILTRPVHIVLESGYERSLRADIEFVVVGQVPQGLVLRPTQTVLTVEGAHMHEAYVVLRDGRLVGFYLPVERAFSALPQAMPFFLVQRNRE